MATIDPSPSSPLAPADDTPSRATTIIAPLTTHTHTVIFLHCREDYGSDLAKYLFDSKSSSRPEQDLRTLFPGVKWVFPTAALRYCAKRDEEFKNSSFAEALKGEEVISQWFDIWDLKEPDEKMELMKLGLKFSVRQIHKIAHEEASLIGKGQVVLGGISQGCATAVYTLLSLDFEIGGFLGVSSWMPFQSIVEQLLFQTEGESLEVAKFLRDALGFPEFGEEENENGGDDSFPIFNTQSYRRLLLEEFCRKLDRKIPVFLSHSMDDETVPFSYGQGLHKNLGKIMTNSPITWKEYEDGGHWIHPQHGVDDISTFLNRSIGIPSPMLGKGGRDITPRVETPVVFLKQEPSQMGYEENCARLEEVELMGIEKGEEEEKARTLIERCTLGPENMSHPLEPYVEYPRKEPRKMGYEEMCERLAKQELREIKRREGKKKYGVLPEKWTLKNKNKTCIPRATISLILEECGELDLLNKGQRRMGSRRAKYVHTSLLPEE